MKLKHLQQVDNASCTSACLAMLLDKPVMSVMSDFHYDWCKQITDPLTYLKAHDVDVEVVPLYISNVANGFYLATVPSLNGVGGLHHIIMEFEDGVCVNVLDPNYGRKDKYIYIAGYQAVLPGFSSPIKHYILELKINY